MTLKLQCKKLWTTLFPSSILLLAFILMSFSLFFESLLYTTIRNAFSLFYFHFIFLFTKMSHHRCIHISECVWIRSISERMHLFLWRTSLRWIFSLILFFLFLAMISYFFASVDDFVIHSMCAHNVLCSAFIQQRGIHLLFIFPFL